MAIVNVWYDVGAQDQWTDTATVDDNGNVSATTSQYIQTYFVLDDGGGTKTIPPFFVALGAADPITGLTVLTKGQSVSSGGKLPHRGTPVYRKYDIEDQADLNPVFDGLT